MLDQNLINALTTHTAAMTKSVTLLLKTGEHPKRAELLEFLKGVASSSEKINLEERDEASLRSPLSFSLCLEGQDTGVTFSGIPGGHEFTSLVLAILRAGGVPPKIDSSIQTLIKGIEAPLEFEIFVSLSCHNCPEVVQAVQQFALLNSNITAEMIDGGDYPELIQARNIQGVPAVFLNGEPFANGKIEVGDMVERLVEKYPQQPGLESPSNDVAIPTQDMTVIGGGPAGVAAAIYAARKGLAVTLVADRLGGQVKDTMGIENFISIPKTTGPDMVGAMASHLGDYDITIKEHLRVKSIEDKGTLKTITLSSGTSFDTKTVIIASGAKWRELGVPGEKENIGQGVAYCPHCDGPFFKGRDVAVVGGGNSGVEAALDLAGIVKSVTLIEWAPELKADQILVDQLAKRKNIRVMTNQATQNIQAEGGKVCAIELEDRDSKKAEKIDLAAVFVQIGLVPNSHFVKELVELSPYGEIVVNDRCETNVSGIYAAGDVTTVPYKQIVVAMGEGSKAALSAFEFLLKSM